MKAFATAAIIALVACLLLIIQHNQVIALEGQVTIEAKSKQDAVDANKESQATITTLRADLAKRINASEQKAKKARKDFEDLKRNSKPVRDWAAQPLPDGLRGKPAAAGNKDSSSKSRAP